MMSLRINSWIPKKGLDLRLWGKLCSCTRTTSTSSSRWGSSPKTRAFLQARGQGLIQNHVWNHPKIMEKWWTLILEINSFRKSVTVRSINICLNLFQEPICWNGTEVGGRASRGNWKRSRRSLRLWEEHRLTPLSTYLPRSKSSNLILSQSRKTYFCKPRTSPSKERHLLLGHDHEGASISNSCSNRGRWFNQQLLARDATGTTTRTWASSLWTWTALPQTTWTTSRSRPFPLKWAEQTCPRPTRTKGTIESSTSQNQSHPSSIQSTARANKMVRSNTTRMR